MPYSEDSLAGRVLRGDAKALAQLILWISHALTWPHVWSLREEWADLTQETLARVLESLRHERFDAARDLRVYVQSIARYAASRAIKERMHPKCIMPPDLVLQHPATNPERNAIDRQLV